MPPGLSLGRIRRIQLEAIVSGLRVPESVRLSAPADAPPLAPPRVTHGALLLAALLAFVAPPEIGRAAEFEESATLVADPRPANAFLGTAVALHGDTALVGAPSETIDAFREGAAYVFELEGGAWTQTARLVAPLPTERAALGSAVALGDGIAFVAAPRDATLGAFAGAVHVFRREADGTWSLTQTLHSPTGLPGDLFGTALAFDPVAGRLAVGAPGDDTDGPSAGAVSSYEDDGTGTWALVARNFGPPTSLGSEYGAALALEADTLLVGAPRDDTMGANAGAVHAYHLGPLGVWSPTGVLFAPDAAPTHFFGAELALRGDVALAASPFDDDVDVNAGSVQLLERVGGIWTFVQELVASDATDRDTFGRSLALGDGVAVIGAPLAAGPVSRSGVAYLFERDGAGWVETARLAASDAAFGDTFAASLALDGRTLLVGCPGDDDSSGSARVFTSGCGTHDDLRERLDDATLVPDALRRELRREIDRSAEAFDAGDDASAGRFLCLLVRRLEVHAGVHLDASEAEAIACCAIELAEALGLVLDCPAPSLGLPRGTRPPGRTVFACVEERLPADLGPRGPRPLADRPARR